MTRLAEARSLLAAALDGRPEADQGPRLQALITARGLTAGEGVAIYRDSSHRARERALEAIYPVCRQVLGARCFAALAESGRADQVRVHPSASLRLLASPYPVRELWRRHRKGGDTTSVPSGEGERLAIRRVAWRPSIEPLSRARFELLAALQRGESLDRLAALGLELEQIPRLIEEGWILAFTAGKTGCPA